MNIKQNWLKNKARKRFSEDGYWKSVTEILVYFYNISIGIIDVT